MGSGCRSRVPVEFVSPYDPAQVATGSLAVHSLDDLRETLAARTRHHEQIWMRSDVTIEQEGRSGRDFFTALVLYQAPDMFRLRGSRVPIGTVFDVLLRDDQATLHFPREGRMFVGGIDTLAEKASAIGGLTPRDLVTAVLVQHHLSELLNDPSRRVVWSDRGEHILLASRHDGSGRHFFWLVRKEDGLVEEMLVRTAIGREELRVRYLGYLLIANEEGEPEPFPSDLQFFVPGEGLEISSAGSEYRLQPGLSPRAFEQPSAREVYPLAALQFEEPR
ncbi:MAG: hypothetical protein JJU11_06500 [Candidatus Sumerlaeia bacterium]|nr:hypothetical protein [Candidatus Sumerlaeia bacterium]